MNPGATTRPVASSTRCASPARPPTATSLPPLIEMSPWRPGRPEPSTISPLRMTRSSMDVPLLALLLFECREHGAPRTSHQLVERADPCPVERGSAGLLVERDGRGAAVVVGELDLDLGPSVVAADDGGARDGRGHRAGGGSVNTTSLGSRPMVRRAARCRFHDSSCWS